MTPGEARTALRKYIDYLCAPVPRMDALRAARRGGGTEDLTIQHKLNDLISDLWALYDKIPRKEE